MNSNSNNSNNNSGRPVRQQQKLEAVCATLLNYLLHLLRQSANAMKHRIITTTTTATKDDNNNDNDNGATQHHWLTHSPAISPLFSSRCVADELS